jgi:phosphatidate cytidylyltransferase
VGEAAAVSELAKRWAVAGVGIPAVLALLCFGGWAMAAFCAVAAGLGAWECYRLGGRDAVAPLDGIGVGYAVALVLFAAWRPTFVGFAPVALALVGSFAMVGLVIAMFARGPTGSPLQAVAIGIFGALYAGLSLAFVPLLHGLPDAEGWADGTSEAAAAWGGAMVVVLPLAATWIGDAAAFFVGKAWGKGGLAPTISPKKSWEGFWAGLVGAGAAGSLWWLVARDVLPRQPIASPLVAAVVGVVLGVGAVLGDLSESLLKRQAGVKDSGTLFPGHGGVLDRLDALTFTLPLAYAAFALLEALA